MGSPDDRSQLVLGELAELVRHRTGTLQHRGEVPDGFPAEPGTNGFHRAVDRTARGSAR